MTCERCGVETEDLWYNGPAPDSTCPLVCFDCFKPQRASSNYPPETWLVEMAEELE